MRSEDWLEQQSVIISFTAQGASLDIEESIDEPALRRIALRLQLERREHVWLPDNRTLKDAHWSLNIVEATETVKNPKEQKAIGTLWHFDENAEDIWGDNSSPESCYIHAALEPGNFAALLKAIQTGRFPFRLNVTVQGLKYAGLPDGSSKVWDVKANPQVAVIKVSFNVRLTALDIDSDTFSNSEQLEEIDHLPASSADIRALQQFLGENFDLLKLSAWKAFIGFVVLASVLIWFFRH